MEHVILVDESDNATGTAQKMEAHQRGLLHRAFSIFLFNESGEMLIQQRASDKYHSAGLFSNTCCSHPRPGEKTKVAARRRLKEEMGVDCDLVSAFEMPYRAEFNNGLIENEYDHIFVGLFSGHPVPDPREVKSWRWIKFDELFLWLQNQPDQFTVWFELAADRAIEVFEEWNAKRLKNQGETLEIRRRRED